MYQHGHWSSIKADKTSTGFFQLLQHIHVGSVVSTGSPHAEKCALQSRRWQERLESGWRARSPSRLSSFSLITSKQRRQLTDLSLRTNLAESMFGEFLRTPRFYVPTCRQLNPSSKTSDWGHFHCSFVVWTSCLNSLTLLPSLHLSLNSETWVNNMVDHQSSKTGQRGRRLFKPWVGWWNISNITS